MKKIITILVLTFSTAWASASQGAWARFDYDRESYEVAHNNQEVRSIASITKLFTAITVLRSGVDLNELVTVQGTSSGRIPNGTLISRNDLIKMMLVSSDNRAAETLANSHPGGFGAFIYDTNKWIRSEGLFNTEIVDSTGLQSGNVSTVDDIIKVMFIGRNYKEINHTSAEKEAEVQGVKGKKIVRVKFRNTNPSVFSNDHILLSKTGFTNAAGRCVAMLVESGQRLYAVVILGQKNSQVRTKIASQLISIIN